MAGRAAWSRPGVDAYGIDPRPGRADRAETAGTDLRDEGLLEHLAGRRRRPASGPSWSSGRGRRLTPGERDRLLDLVDDRLAPAGILVVHSLSLAAWAADDVPPEADLAPGRPLRPATWTALLGARGYAVTVTPGPEGRDYLVAAVAGAGSPASRSTR